jgi:hypothetical protein
MDATGQDYVTFLRQHISVLQHKRPQKMKRLAAEAVRVRGLIY